MRSGLFRAWPLCLLAALTTVWVLPVPARAEPVKVWGLKPAKGFVDDPMAFDPTDSRFAYIHTDSATFLKITVLSTQGFKQEQEMALQDSTLVSKKLVFSADGKRLILIWMDGYNGTHGAMVFEVQTGKLHKKLGPATHAEVAVLRGEQVISLTEVKTDKKGESHHAIAVHRTSDLKRVGNIQLTLRSDNTIKQPPIRLLYWEPGHLSLVGTTKGKYDKKRDIRLPDRAVRYDLMARKVTWSAEPQELMRWNQAINMRPDHPGQLRFLQVSDDNKKLQVVDQDNSLGTVTTPVDWMLYEHKSLAQEETWDGQNLFFSMTVDPVNPAAVKRKKADPERMDLYRLDPGPKAKLLGQVPTDKRRFTWQVGQRHFAYLHKLKGFGRGGREVKVFTIGAGPAK